MRDDRARLSKRLRGVERAKQAGKPINHPLGQIKRDLEKALERRRVRAEACPAVTFPEELPVSARRAEIAEAIEHHQVVVVCGETGSGKTTQLPKICLELGRGIDGVIGHTQPRRLAARSVARRIADELKVPFGKQVGAKVRFTDETGPDTLVKLMTDGILLAETQRDRRLERYDTIIIDEAHERSLNIDFLLGYLREVLPKRRDLKIIVTSATIDPHRFADHFAPAVEGGEVPVIEVSGRTYPVEVRYRPLRVDRVEDEGGEDAGVEEVDLIDGVIAALDEAEPFDPTGHALVFMPGEREIRDTAEALEEHFAKRRKDVEIMPLFARLSPADQQRIFAPTKKRRVVIATNIAETSLTVPGITVVIDPGLARVNRYSARSKVQRLPIEAISRASADQRKGRCGRIAPGLCIRLYDEAEFETRPEFTDPEIVRTNLASVVLQMLALRLGDIERFPFVERPEKRQIRDGVDTLRELGAIDEEKNLTDVGRELAKLPVDPRIGRMILAATDERCLEDVLVIAAGLSIQDPRLRPADKRNEADTAHEVFAHEMSDFLALVNVWSWYRKERKKLSGRKLMAACRDRFVSHLRMREWEDVHRQLRELCEELGYKARGDKGDYAQVHRALLAGLLSNVGNKKNKVDYNAPHGLGFNLHPGSVLFQEKPGWVMASEIVRTERTFARVCAQIEPKWIEQVGAHLIAKRYQDPRWSERRGKVLAIEHTSLFGLPIYSHHNTDYSGVNPAEARELFIHHALVEGEYGGEPAFLAHNAAMIATVEEMEHKARQRDILVEKSVRYAFYDERVPRDITNRERFERWFANEVKREPALLRMTEGDLIDAGASAVEAAKFPDALPVGESSLPLTYAHTPGEKSDGVTMTVPLEALPNVDAHRAEWLVPGLRTEKVESLLKTLPKPIRRQFVPLKEYAERVAIELGEQVAEGSFRDAVKAVLERLSGVPIPDDALRREQLPEHLRMNFRVVDAGGEVVEEGRDLPTIRQKLSKELQARLTDVADEAYRRDGITAWDFGDLPESVEFERAGASVRGFPALVDKGGSVSLRLLGTRTLADYATVRGLRRLFLFEVGREVAYQIEHLPGADRTLAYAATLPGGGLSTSALADQIAAVAVDLAFLKGREIVRTREAFTARLDEGWHRVGQAASEAADLAHRILAARHALLLDLEGPVTKRFSAATRDVSAQLAALCPQNLMVVIPTEWLGHLPRYLSAARMRLSKVRTETEDRDRAHTAEVNRFEQMYNAGLRSGRHGGVPSPELVRYRWMIEELRVSLFAQELGTSAPVSAKRLTKLYEQAMA